MSFGPCYRDVVVVVILHRHSFPGKQRGKNFPASGLLRFCVMRERESGKFWKMLSFREDEANPGELLGRAGSDEIIIVRWNLLLSWEP